MAINKNFIVDAGLEVKAAATVNGSITSAGGITANGNLVANGSITGNGSITANGNLVANGSGTFNSGVTANGAFTVNRSNTLSNTSGFSRQHLYATDNTFSELHAFGLSQIRETDGANTSGTYDILGRYSGAALPLQGFIKLRNSTDALTTAFKFPITMGDGTSGDMVGVDYYGRLHIGVPLSGSVKRSALNISGGNTSIAFVDGLTSNGTSKEAFIDARNGDIIINTDIRNSVAGSLFQVNVDGSEKLTVNAESVVIRGNLVVTGSTTTVNTATLNVADNIITLNSDWAAATPPTENAGVEVNRGNAANVALRWNEGNDTWEVTQDGTSFGRIHSKLTDIALGTDTSGAYIASASSSTAALTLSGTGGESATLTGSIRTASTSVDGIVTLTDAISNTSAGVAGSATAVKTAYDSAIAVAANATNISSGTLSADRLALSGVTAGAYGTSSAIPVITVDNKGRVTALSTTSVAGVTGYTYTGANNTFTISTGTGTTFTANISSLTGTFGINITGTANNATYFGDQLPAYYTNITGRLGYTPVRQGGGTDQLNNTVYIGWSAGSRLRLQVDSTDFGATWPININGNATTATNATDATNAQYAGIAGTANALNTLNSYQGVNFTATGRFLAANGTAPAPSIAFSSDGATDTGFYWSADGYINMTNNGVYGGQFGPGGTLNTVGAITASQFNGSGAGLTGTAASLTAGAVAWTNVSGRPTAVSAFTNDSGYVTSAGSVAFATSAGSVAWTNVSGRPTALSSFTNDTAYITSDGRAYPRRSDGGDLNFYWSGQSGQPTWLWGGNDGVNMYVYNPSNFSVSYAASAGNSSTVGGLAVHSGTNNEANKVVRTDVNGYLNTGYINSAAGNEGNNSNPPRVWGTNGSDSYIRSYLTSALSVSYAASAGSVAWTNVSGRPTAVSSFTNDSGYVTSAGSVAFASSAGSVAWTNVSGRPTTVSAFTNDSGYVTSSGSVASATIASTVSINYNNDSNSTYQMLWGSGTSVYGTGGIYCNPASDIIYAGDFYVTSDDRLKDRIGNVTNALAAVNSLNGFKFTWNEKATELRNYTNETTQVGVSAQEVEAILPEAVHTDEDGYKTVSYDSLVPLLIEAIKELTLKVARLEAR